MCIPGGIRISPFEGNNVTSVLKFLSRTLPLFYDRTADRIYRAAGFLETRRYAVVRKWLD